MRRDLIVEEVRKNRAAIAREHGNDVDAIITAFQREDAASGVQTVSLRPKRLPKPEARHTTVKARRPKALQPTSRARKTGLHSKVRRRAVRG